MGSVKTKGTLYALTLGSIGGALFYVLNLPLPWMLGSMTVCAFVSLSGWQPFKSAPFMPKWLRGGMLSVLAVMLGSSFSPALWDQMGRWSLSLATLFGIMALSVALSMAYLRRWGQFSPATAYFSSAPGGISEMVVTGAAMGGDERSIAFIHSLRILLIVFTIPVGYRIITGLHSPSMLDSMGRLHDMTLADGVWLLGVAIVGALFGRLVRLPAAILTGPLLASATIHVLGLTTSRPPGELVIMAQVVTGAGLGARFVGVRWRDVSGLVKVSLGTTAILISLSAAAAAMLAWGTGLPFALLLLAFIPGGIAEMCLITLSLGQDVAFVSVHHVLRVVLVIVAAPLLFRVLQAIRNRRHENY